jgi:hypothetical protein
MEQLQSGRINGHWEGNRLEIRVTDPEDSLVPYFYLEILLIRVRLPLAEANPLIAVGLREGQQGAAQEQNQW